MLVICLVDIFNYCTFASDSMFKSKYWTNNNSYFDIFPSSRSRLFASQPSIVCQRAIAGYQPYQPVKCRHSKALGVGAPRGTPIALARGHSRSASLSSVSRIRDSTTPPAHDFATFVSFANTFVAPRLSTTGNDKNPSTNRFSAGRKKQNRLKKWGKLYTEATGGILHHGRTNGLIHGYSEPCISNRTTLHPIPRRAIGIEEADCPPFFLHITFYIPFRLPLKKTCGSKKWV